MSSKIPLSVMERPKRPVHERGEFLDATPVFVPTALKMVESTDERIRRLMQEQRAWVAYANRMDEGDDDFFDFDEDELDQDDPRFISPHEDRWKPKFERRYQKLTEPAPDPDPVDPSSDPVDPSSE